MGATAVTKPIVGLDTSVLNILVQEQHAHSVISDLLVTKQALVPQLSVEEAFATPNRIVRKTSLNFVRDF